MRSRPSGNGRYTCLNAGQSFGQLGQRLGRGGASRGPLELGQRSYHLTQGYVAGLWLGHRRTSVGCPGGGGLGRFCPGGGGLGRFCPGGGWSRQIQSPAEVVSGRFCPGRRWSRQILSRERWSRQILSRERRSAEGRVDWIVGTAGKILLQLAELSNTQQVSSVASSMAADWVPLVRRPQR